MSSIFSEVIGSSEVGNSKLQLVLSQTPPLDKQSIFSICSSGGATPAKSVL